MSVLIASKYWTHYLSVPKEPPGEANGSRINWLVQGSLLPVQFCYCAIYMCGRRESRCFEAEQFLHSTNYSPFAWLLQLMLYGQRHYCHLKKQSKIFTKNTGLNWQPLRNFSNQTFGFLVLLCFLKPMLICGVGVTTWECTPLQEILTRKRLSSTEIWRDICSPDWGIDQWLGHLTGMLKTYSSSVPALH